MYLFNFLDEVGKSDQKVVGKVDKIVDKVD